MEKKRSSLIPYLIFTLFIALFVGFNVFAYKEMNSLIGFISEFGMLVIFTAFFKKESNNKLPVISNF